MISIEDQASDYASTFRDEEKNIIFTAYLAGAAAMAETFASGQALKIERTPGKYFLSYTLRGVDNYPKKRDICVNCITDAYSSTEAIQTIMHRLVVRYGIYVADRIPDEIRPALDSDTESEKEIV